MRLLQTFLLLVAQVESWKLISLVKTNKALFSCKRKSIKPLCMTKLNEVESTDIKSNIPTSMQDILKSNYINNAKALSSVAALSALSLFPGNSKSDTRLPPPALPILQSDEIAVLVQDETLGIGLIESEYKDRLRVIVSSVKDGASDDIRQTVKPQMILIGINDQSIEGLASQRIFPIIKTTPRPCYLIFRDPTKFSVLLRQTAGQAAAAATTVTTTILPGKLAKDGKQQILRVDMLHDNSLPVSASSLVVRGEAVLELAYHSYLLSNLDKRKIPVDIFPSDSEESITSFQPGYDVNNSRLLNNDTTFFAFSPPAAASNGKVAPPAVVSYVSFSGGSNKATPALSYSTGSPIILNYLPSVWQSLLLGMQIGEVRRLTLPPAYYRNGKSMQSRLADIAKAASLSEYRLKSSELQLVVEVKLLSINGLVM